MTIKPRSIDDVALNPRALCKRYSGTSWETISQRWMKERDFPAPDFYVGRTPFVYLSTVQAWEASNPATAPDHAIRHANPSSAEAS